MVQVCVQVRAISFRHARVRTFRPPDRDAPGAQTQNDWGECIRVDLGDPDGPTTAHQRPAIVPPAGRTGWRNEDD
jgi:hypothetical protein